MRITFLTNHSTPAMYRTNRQKVKSHIDHTQRNLLNLNKLVKIFRLEYKKAAIVSCNGSFFIENSIIH